jgi:hypothetical protein
VSALFPGFLFGRAVAGTLAIIEAQSVGPRQVQAVAFSSSLLFVDRFGRGMPAPTVRAALSSAFAAGWALEAPYGIREFRQWVSAISLFAAMEENCTVRLGLVAAMSEQAGHTLATTFKEYGSCCGAYVGGAYIVRPVGYVRQGDWGEGQGFCLVTILKPHLDYSTAAARATTVQATRWPRSACSRWRHPRGTTFSRGDG